MVRKGFGVLNLIMVIMHRPIITSCVCIISYCAVLILHYVRQIDVKHELKNLKETQIT